MRDSPLQDPMTMRRRQLAGAIGFSSLSIERFQKLLEQAVEREDEQLQWYAAQRLVWARERLQECRDEWDRRGYVSRTEPRKRESP